MKLTGRILIGLILFNLSCSVNTGSNKYNQGKEIFEFVVNSGGEGAELIIDFYSGPSFYYPLVAIWLEESDGTYIQTLYVSESVARSVFMYGEIKNGEWVPGVKRYPQTLPYWSHKRGIRASDGLYMPEPESPVPDAYTGASPVSSFRMTGRPDNIISRPFKVMLEINQNWDWNDYWTNDLFPDDEYYKLSCQPALVYEALIHPGDSSSGKNMVPVGHSHHSGKTGELFTDISTLTTALEIADSIIVRIPGK